MKIKIYLIDDHSVVRYGLRMLIEGDEDVVIIGESGSATEALTAISKLKPDVVLMDISLPDLSGIEATREIKRLWPEIAVVALTIHEDEEYFFKMLDAGASGYVPKRAAPEELLTAIHAANSGDVYLYPSLAKLLVKDYILDQGLAEKEKSIDDLTPRQKEVLIQLGEGGNNLEIAARLNISPNTVARHRENIMHKLNLHSRTELVKYAIRKGYIEL
ncbi:MAG: response regulator transcription factor [Anaerolineales bacterium]